MKKDCRCSSFTSTRDAEVKGKKASASMVKQTNNNLLAETKTVTFQIRSCQISPVVYDHEFLCLKKPTALRAPQIDLSM